MRGPKPHRLLQAIPENSFQSAPRTGIEPVFAWFRARCNDQQLPPRCKRKLSTPSGNRTRSASFRGLRRDYAPESDFRSGRVSCGNRTHLTGLEVRRLCRSAKDTVEDATFEGQSVKRSELSHTSRFTLQTSRSSGGKTRTFTRLVNREPPYRWATPEN